MAKDISLKLKIDSKSGQAQIKKTTTGLKKLGTVGKKAADKLSKGFAAAAAKMKLLAVGMAASTAAIGYMAKKTLDSADATAKLAASLGYSTKLIQEYSYAAGLSGVSQETLNNSLLAFTKRVGEAKAGTGALIGYLKKTDKALLNQLTSTTDVNQALGIFMSVLGGVKDITKQNALASAAFSRAGMGMTVMVKDGTKSFNAMKKEAHDLGLILSGDLLDNAQRINDDISKLSQVVMAQFNRAVLELAPEVEKVAKWMLEWVKANKELISQKTGSTIDGCREALQKIWTIISYDPAIFEWGLLGLSLFGRKGAIIMGGLAHIEKAIENMGAAIILASSGVIEWSDLATANFKELEKLLDNPKQSVYLQHLTSNAEDLKIEIAKLKKQTSGLFFFPSDKAKIIALQKELEDTLHIINKIKNPVKDKDLLKKGKKALTDSDKTTDVRDMWDPRREAQEEAAEAAAEAIRIAEELNRHKIRLETKAMEKRAQQMKDAADIAREYEEKKLTMMQYFNEQYNQIGKSKFDIERDQLLSWKEEQLEIWAKTEEEKARLEELYADKSKAIAAAETQSKLSMYQNMAGGIANTFQQIAQAGGKQSKKAFKIYKAFSMVEAGIAGTKAVLQAMSAYPPPYSFVMAGIAAAAAATQIAMISAAQPPSYDQGGISNARGVYQTGDIKEAHIPIPSGGRIPVKVDGNQQKPVQIILNNPVFQDLETQRQVMAEIASIVATQIAPGAVVDNYNNDGEIRSIVKGGI